MQGRIEEYSAGSDWSSWSERLAFHLEANDVTQPSKRRACSSVSVVKIRTRRYVPWSSQENLERWNTTRSSVFWVNISIRSHQNFWAAVVFRSETRSPLRRSPSMWQRCERSRKIVTSGRCQHRPHCRRRHRLPRSRVRPCLRLLRQLRAPCFH